MTGQGKEGRSVENLSKGGFKQEKGIYYKDTRMSPGYSRALGMNWNQGSCFKHFHI